MFLFKIPEVAHDDLFNYFLKYYVFNEPWAFFYQLTPSVLKQLQKTI